MRLIDADALWKQFENSSWCVNRDRDDVAEELLLDAPTIDPVKYGKWVSGHEWMPIYVCSICGIRALFDDHGDHALSNYCSNCGAKMDGSDEYGKE